MTSSLRLDNGLGNVVCMTTTVLGVPGRIKSIHCLCCARRIPLFRRTRRWSWRCISWGLYYMPVQDQHEFCKLLLELGLTQLWKTVNCFEWLRRKKEIIFTEKTAMQKAAAVLSFQMGYKHDLKFQWSFRFLNVQCLLCCFHESIHLHSLVIIPDIYHMTDSSQQIIK